MNTAHSWGSTCKVEPGGFFGSRNHTTRQTDATRNWFSPASARTSVISQKSFLPYSFPPSHSKPAVTSPSQGPACDSLGYSVGLGIPQHWPNLAGTFPHWPPCLLPCNALSVATPASVPLAPSFLFLVCLSLFIFPANLIALWPQDGGSLQVTFLSSRLIRLC